LAIVNVIFVFFLYLPSFEPVVPNTSYSPFNALLTALSLVGIGWVLFRGPVLPRRIRAALPSRGAVAPASSG
jgi:hypothetical protein